MSQVITPALIKELRDRTNVGMAKCKEALTEANGDLEQAVQNLRKAGLASASKKSGRDAKEGIIVAAEGPQYAALVEVNAETDFVIRNELFQTFATNVANEIAHTHPKDLESFMHHKYSKDHHVTMEELRAHAVQTIGENIQISRFSCFHKDANHSIGVYSHQGGKIVALVELSGNGNQKELARELAMHATATRPEFVSEKTVPADILAREQEIAMAQVNEQPKLRDKPESVKQNIVDGKMKAFYDENCFLNQKYIKDEKHSVGEFLELQSKALGSKLQLVRFTIWSVGGNS